MNIKVHSRIIGVIELLSFVYYSSNIPLYFKSIICNSISINSKVLLVIQLILVFSIFVSSVIYFIDMKLAYLMYFPQFVLRIVFFMTTFSYIIKINLFFNNNVLSILLSVLVIIFEVIRLLYSIYIVRKID